MSRKNPITDAYFDIDKVMDTLACKKRIFTSEADFQFSLAWEIKTTYPEYVIKLEETLDVGSDEHNFIHVDIIIHTNGGQIIPIELKYCTKKASVEEIDGFILKDQGAEDIRRYDFVKDIQRIESIRDKHIDDGIFIRSYCIFLTNSNRYWKLGNKWESCVDAQFRIHDGIKITKGMKHWSEQAKEGTKRGRTSPLNTDEYDIVWRDYGDTSMRYLCITTI